MTKEEANRILDQHKDGKLFLPSKIKEALAVTERGQDAKTEVGVDQEQSGDRDQVGREALA